MRTAIIIAIGFILLAVCVLAPRLAGRPEWSVTGAKLFIALWLAAALVNMWIGVSRAGYSVAEELPIFLLIFALPAAAAGFAWWKLS
jgi:uncharacterized membrane protein YwaF